MRRRATSPLLRCWFLAYPLIGSGATSFCSVGGISIHSSSLVSAFALHPCRYPSTVRSRRFHVGTSHCRRHSGRAFSTKRQQTPRNTQDRHYATSSSDVLTSTSSNTVKRFVALQQKAKKRRETGETIVEGPRMVLDLLKNPNTRQWVQQIIVASDVDASVRDQLEQVLQEPSADDDDNDNNDDTDSTKHDNIQVMTALPSVVKACSDTVTPQGIVARVQVPLWDPAAIVAEQQTKRAPLYLVLDAVSDPGNMGTLLRSSVAVGVSAVLLLPGSCDVWNPKAVRSAMGGSFLVPTFSMKSWDAAVQQLQEWNCPTIWAATMLQDQQGQVLSTAHFDIDWSEQPHALVIGSEGTGLSPVIRDCLEGSNTTPVVQAVHVPMQGDIESLNAAVCGSVILFEYMRQWQQRHED